MASTWLPPAPRLSIRDERGVRGLEQDRVGGAVDEAGQVAAVAMDEAGPVGGHDEARREGLRGGPGVLEDHVGRAPVDPQPQVVLGRRGVVAAQHPERLERGQILRRVVRIDGAPQVGAEAQDDVDAAGRHGRHAQAFQDGADGRQVHVGPQLELEELVGDRALREDAELGQRHGRRLAHDERRRRTAPGSGRAIRQSAGCRLARSRWLAIPIPAPHRGGR